MLAEFCGCVCFFPSRGGAEKVFRVHGNFKIPRVQDPEGIGLLAVPAVGNPGTCEDSRHERKSPSIIPLGYGRFKYRWFKCPNSWAGAIGIRRRELVVCHRRLATAADNAKTTQLLEAVRKDAVLKKAELKGNV